MESAGTGPRVRQRGKDDRHAGGDKVAVMHFRHRPPQPVDRQHEEEPEGRIAHDLGTPFDELRIHRIEQAGDQRDAVVELAAAPSPRAVGQRGWRQSPPKVQPPIPSRVPCGARPLGSRDRYSNPYRAMPMTSRPLQSLGQHGYRGRHRDRRSESASPSSPAEPGRGEPISAIASGPAGVAAAPLAEPPDGSHIRRAASER